MKKVSYRFCFLLVATAVAAQFLLTLALLLGFTGAGRVSMILSTPIAVLTSPVPALIEIWIPWIVRYLLSWVLIGLVVRRLWIWTKNRSPRVPPSLTTWSSRFLTLAMFSVLSMLVGMLVSILIKAGSGVPAGMLGIPAMFVLCPAIFYIEFKSLVSNGLLEQNALPPADNDEA